MPICCQDPPVPTPETLCLPTAYHDQKKQESMQHTFLAARNTCFSGPYKDGLPYPISKAQQDHCRTEMSFEKFKVDMQGDFWVWQADPAGDSHSADGMLAVSFLACWEGLSVAMVMVPGWIGGCVNIGCIHVYNLLLNSFWMFSAFEIQQQLAMKLLAEIAPGIEMAEETPIRHRVERPQQRDSFLKARVYGAATAFLLSMPTK